MTTAMSETIAECERRRTIQLAYNAKHGMVPTTILKEITDGIEMEILNRDSHELEESITGIGVDKLEQAEQIKALEEEMERFADELRFEEAAALRDKILDIKGEKKVVQGIGGLRKKRGKRSLPAKAAAANPPRSSISRLRRRRKRRSLTVDAGALKHRRQKATATALTIESRE